MNGTSESMTRGLITEAEIKSFVSEYLPPTAEQ